MKTYIKLLVLGLIVAPLLVSLSYSQTQQTGISKDRNYNQPVGVYNASSAGSATNASAGLPTQGPDLGEACSIYLNDQWEPGTIKLKGNTLYENVPMRYNIYNQQMEFVLNGDTAAIGEPATLEYIQIGKKTFVYETFICQNKVRSGYLEVLSEGRLRLLVFHHIKYVSIENDAVLNEEPNKKYHAEKIYLYAFPGENAQKLPEKRKDLLMLFSKDVPDFKTYLKSENNKLRSEQELVAAFNYFNENLSSN